MLVTSHKLPMQREATGTPCRVKCDISWLKLVSPWSGGKGAHQGGGADWAGADNLWLHKKWKTEQ